MQGAQHCFGTPLPDGLLSALAEVGDGEASWLARWRSTPVQTRVTAGMALAPSLEWRVLIRYIWGTVMPSRAYLRWRYDLDPRWPWPLLYLYRWADLAGAGVSTVWQMVRSKQNR